MQHCLIKHDFDLWRVFAGQKQLSCASLFNTLLDSCIVKPRYACPMNRTYVIGDLQQSWNDSGLEDGQGRGILFQAHIGPVSQGERLPPALLLAFPRERHEPFSFGSISDPV